jgi:hypothetical protein
MFILIYFLNYLIFCFKVTFLVSFVLIFRSFQSNWRGQRAKRRQAKLQSQSEDSLGDYSLKKLLVVKVSTIKIPTFLKSIFPLELLI